MDCLTPFLRRGAGMLFAGLAACSNSSGPSNGVPAQIVVTVVQGVAPPITSIGFPTTIPHGASTLQFSAYDSASRPITLDPARYQATVTPVVVPGVYQFTLANNLTMGVNVTTAATLSVQWKLVDVIASRTVIGPVTTNVVFQ
ncbi:MAG: hypothetical protein HY275_05995 [Gemmatimonadetes bacterium]|nr:hypothetical protein [Gemmatimonadota bacterium]